MISLFIWMSPTLAVFPSLARFLSGYFDSHKTCILQSISHPCDSEPVTHNKMCRREQIIFSLLGVYLLHVDYVLAKSETVLIALPGFVTPLSN